MVVKWTMLTTTPLTKRNQYISVGLYNVVGIPDKI